MKLGFQKNRDMIMRVNMWLQLSTASFGTLTTKNKNRNKRKQISIHLVCLRKVLGALKKKVHYNDMKVTERGNMQTLF